MDKYWIQVGQIYKWDAEDTLFRIDLIGVEGNHNTKYIVWSMKTTNGWDTISGHSNYKYATLVESLDEGLCKLYNQSTEWSLTPLNFI